MATSTITSDAHSSWLAADDKFNYFLLGISAALLAYLGEKFVPAAPSLSQNTIELCSIVSLCVAFVSSLLRIEQKIMALGINLEILNIADDQSELVQALYESSPQYNSRTGEAFDPSAGEKNLALLNAKEDHVHSLFDKCQRKVSILYLFQKWTLIVGLIGMVGARIFTVVTISPTP